MKKIKKTYAVKCPTEFIRKLEMKRYSQNTIRTYKSMLCDFINFNEGLNIEQINRLDITDFKRYIYHLVSKRKVSTSFQNQAINAIKFYYEQVLGRKKIFVKYRFFYKLMNIFSYYLYGKELMSYCQFFNDYLRF